MIVAYKREKRGVRGCSCLGEQLCLIRHSLYFIGFQNFLFLGFNTLSVFFFAKRKRTLSVLFNWASSQFSYVIQTLFAVINKFVIILKMTNCSWKLGNGSRLTLISVNSQIPFASSCCLVFLKFLFQCYKIDLDDWWLSFCNEFLRLALSLFCLSSTF